MSILKIEELTVVKPKAGQLNRIDIVDKGDVLGSYDTIVKDTAYSNRIRWTVEF